MGPNVLIIVADDLGWGDVGYHGSRIRTPALDQLARTGVELDQHYVCPMCTPTRASLMAGRYPGRWGDHALTPSNERVFPWGTKTLASALRAQGYDTGISGKWHLGSLPEWGPNHFGFDRSYGSLAGGVGCYDHRYKQGPYTYTWHRDGELVDEDGHVTDLIGREAEGSIREASRPWFVYVPFTAVHIPVEAPSEYVDDYTGDSFSEDPEKDEAYRRYAAYATQMDTWIGRFVTALEETGQRDNTLILFFSDNGSARGWRYQGLYPGTYPDSAVLGSNLPLRGWKAETYEGGIRTPALVNWRGTLEPHVCSAPMHAVDWMPTLCGLVGHEPERDPRWDGTDVWPILAGEVPEPPERTLYWPFAPNRWAIRHGDWKLLQMGDETEELYHLADDPYEEHDLAPEMPNRVAELRERLAEMRAWDVVERPADP